MKTETFLVRPRIAQKEFDNCAVRQSLINPEENVKADALYLFLYLFFCINVGSLRPKLKSGG